MGAEWRSSKPLRMVRELRLNQAMKACTNGAGIVRVIGMSSGRTVIASTLAPSLDLQIRTSGGRHGAVKKG